MAGLVTLSIELELGWGKHDLDDFAHLSPDRTAESQALDRLLDCCEALSLPISFDIVGHLLQERCLGHHDGPYPAGWWDHDPGTDEATDPLFYAPSLVDRIRRADTDHELCTHTYSHILADEVPDTVVAHELAAVRDAHRQHGLPDPTSIVMPRHRNAPTRPLRDAGITTIRKPLSGYDRPNLGPLRTLSWILTRDHPVTSLQQTDGLVETFCTPHPSLTTTTLPQGQSPPHGAFRAMPVRLRQRLQTRYLRDSIDRAAATEGHVHLWTHLYNLANDAQWSPLRDGLAYLAEKRNRDQVQVACMRALPGHV